MDLPPISRAKTCQNCRFAQFGKRNETFYGGGKKINGLCMKFADAPIPQHFDVSIYVPYAFMAEAAALGFRGHHPIVAKFKDARTVDDLPSLREFAEAVALNPRYRLPNQPSIDNVTTWFLGCYEWSAWWIRNWQSVAERRIDRTTVCDGWDGTQTSKFYREPKRKKK